MRGLLPTVGELLRRDLLPGDLVEIALHKADRKWMHAAADTDPEHGVRVQRYLTLEVISFVSEERDATGQWVPIRLTPEDFSAGDHVGTIDPMDADALENLVLRTTTARRVSEASLDIIAQMAEADETPPDLPEPAEEVQSIRDWGEFRGQPESAPGGADGEPLGDTPESPAADGG